MVRADTSKKRGWTACVQPSAELQDGYQSRAEGGGDTRQDAAPAQVDLGKIPHRLVAPAEVLVTGHWRRRRAFRPRHELVTGGITPRPEVEQRHPFEPVADRIAQPREHRRTVARGDRP